MPLGSLVAVFQRMSPGPDARISACSALAGQAAGKLTRHRAHVFVLLQQMVRVDGKTFREPLELLAGLGVDHQMIAGDVERVELQEEIPIWKFGCEDRFRQPPPVDHTPPNSVR